MSPRDGGCSKTGFKTKTIMAIKGNREKRNKKQCQGRRVGVPAKSAFPSEELQCRHLLWHVNSSGLHQCKRHLWSWRVVGTGWSSLLPLCKQWHIWLLPIFHWNTHYLSEPLSFCPCYSVESSSPGTWQVRSDSHWNETRNDPTKAQPTDNESTLCWQELLQREMSMGLLLPAISLSWWQPCPLLCLQAICFPGCWKAGKYQETLQKWCIPWPCLIIVCYEVALSWRLGCQQLWHSSHLVHMVTQEVAFGGHCFCWAVLWLSKELGDCRQWGSQISAVSLLLC